MIGLAVDQSGKIYASYDNGNTELLGQIAVAQFANASGLEKIGDNCYQTTLNSGEFDGVGTEQQMWKKRFSLFWTAQNWHMFCAICRIRESCRCVLHIMKWQ